MGKRGGGDQCGLDFKMRKCVVFCSPAQCAGGGGGEGGGGGGSEGRALANIVLGSIDDESTVHCFPFTVKLMLP